MNDVICILDMIHICANLKATGFLRRTLSFGKIPLISLFLKWNTFPSSAVQAATALATSEAVNFHLALYTIGSVCKSVPGMLVAILGRRLVACVHPIPSFNIVREAKITKGVNVSSCQRPHT